MKRALIIVLVLLLTHSVSAQWGMWDKLSTFHYVPDKIINFYGNMAVACRYNDLNIMKYSYDILISEDHGDSWVVKCRFSSTPDTTVSVTNLAVSNNLLYMLVQFETNYTRTFRIYTLNYAGYLNNLGICNGLEKAFNPSVLMFHHGFMFIGGDLDGDPKVYRSADSGSNWILPGTSPGNNGVVTDMYSHGGRLFVTEVNNSGIGLYYSDDDGISWIAGGPDGYSPVASIEGNDSRLFISEYDDLYYSDDNGTTWQYMDANGTFFSHYLVVRGNEVIAGNGFTDQLLTSHYNGESFYYHDVENFSGLTDIKRSCYDAVDDQKNYYFINKIADQMVLRRLPLYADTVTYRMNGISQNDAISMVMKNDDVLVTTSRNGVYYSSDHAASWFTRKNQLNDKNVRMFVDYNSLIYAATDKGLYYSDNSGVDWTQEASFGKSPVSLLVVHDNSLWLTIDSKVYRQEAPHVWNEDINAGLPESTINYLYSSSDSLYACTGLGVYILDMPTLHWNRMPATNYNATSIVKTDNRLFVSTGNSVLMSEDYGVTWETSSFTGKVNYLTMTDTSVFAATNTGLFCYDRPNHEWISYFFIDMQVSDIKFDESRIFVAARGGIYAAPLNGILSFGEFEHDTNVNLYPVPFTSFITIGLNRHSSGNIHIEFTNSCGYTAYESTVKSAGNRFVINDLAALPPGLYIISLTVDNKIYSRKVIKCR